MLTSKGFGDRMGGQHFEVSSLQQTFERYPSGSVIVHDEERTASAFIG